MRAQDELLEFQTSGYRAVLVETDHEGLADLGPSVVLHNAQPSL